jgi:hypothetical protein
VNAPGRCLTTPIDRSRTSSFNSPVQEDVWYDASLLQI